ncbi:MAG: methionine--tRNA ligase, partial [Candidatus Thermoplasmatota archaeon]
LDLLSKGDIYKGEMQSPYCPKCAKFLPDRYVRGRCPHCGFKEARGDQCDECGRMLDPEELQEPRCSHCASAFEIRRTEHYFLRLSAFQERLMNWIESKEGRFKPNVMNFTRNFLAAGLKDRAITRDLTWGVPVPVDGFDGKSMYVWFEAVIGYLSAAVAWARARGDPEAWKGFWQDPKCRHYYFLAKDNIPFHTIVWPAILMGCGGLNMPYDVPANEYLRWGTEKFSRSRGVGMTVQEFLSIFEVDPLRYYLSVQMPELHDAEFILDDFIARANNELVNAIGNFVHRTLSFTHRHFGIIPHAGEMDGEDKAAIDRIEEHVGLIAAAIERCEFKRGIRLVTELAREGNRYFDAKAPWALIKEDRNRCGTVLYVSLRFVKALAVVLYPYLPGGAERIWRSLGYPSSMAVHWADALSGLEEGTVLPAPEPVFRKVEYAEAPSPLEALEIRIGRVEQVEEHPNAEKLLVLQVLIGEERRQLVAGLKAHYRKEEMEGKRIAVLCNLEPAKLRGVISEGMLLAAEDRGRVSLLTAPEEVPLGTMVDGCAPAPKITFQEFQRYDLRVGVRTPSGIALDGGSGDIVPVLVHDSETVPLSAGGVSLRLDRPVSPGAKIR